jgi:hypothetical protein
VVSTFEPSLLPDSELEPELEFESLECESELLDESSVVVSTLESSWEE